MYLINPLRIPALSLFVIWSLSSCRNSILEAPVPDQHWDLFDSVASRPLPSNELPGLEGVYVTTKGTSFFGDGAAGRWSYTITGKDTAYHFSLFCESEAAYIILQGKRLGSSVLLNGYWRKVENTETSKARLVIRDASALDTTDRKGGSLVISGHYGIGSEIPDKPVAFTWQRPLFRGKDMEIIAHRGGGRNNDLLPASENSLEMIRLAARYGATGVEIDVKLTEDGVPVLYHDSRINDRLTEKFGVRGPVEDYTLAELQAIKLKRGGTIPTLREALRTILEETPLRLVWLDAKYGSSLQPVHDLQKEFMAKAGAAGKSLEIMIGIPDEAAFNNFRLLKNHKEIPSLCELDTAMAASINAKVWAPSWTDGHQTEVVARMQAQNRRAFVWTMDVPDKIEEFLKEGRFNGMVSNRPGLVAYYYYSQQ